MYLKKRREDVVAHIMQAQRSAVPLITVMDFGESYGGAALEVGLITESIQLRACIEPGRKLHAKVFIYSIKKILEIQNYK